MLAAAFGWRTFPAVLLGAAGLAVTWAVLQMIAVVVLDLPFATTAGLAFEPVVMLLQAAATVGAGYVSWRRYCDPDRHAGYFRDHGLPTASVQIWAFPVRVEAPPSK